MYYYIPWCWLADPAGADNKWPRFAADAGRVAFGRKCSWPWYTPIGNPAMPHGDLKRTAARAGLAPRYGAFSLTQKVNSNER